MPQTAESTCIIPYTTGSTLRGGLHVIASVGGGKPHPFQVDTGSVGMLVPLSVLGTQYQSDLTKDAEFKYLSSGNSYWGHWVKVNVVLGIPENGVAGANSPTAEIDVFAVVCPSDFDGGVLGIGFGINGMADGGPCRNPLLHLSFQGTALSAGYIVTAQALQAGLTADNIAGFEFIQLIRKTNSTDPRLSDWVQPTGRVEFANGFFVDLPVLVDTGIAEMLLFMNSAVATSLPSGIVEGVQFPNGKTIGISAPPIGATTVPALEYSFTTGAADQPMAPTYVEWRQGSGINTGAMVLGGYDYLFDSVSGSVGFRKMNS